MWVRPPQVLHLAHRAHACTSGSTLVGVKSWMGRVRDSGGNLGSFSHGWLSTTPCVCPQALILEGTSGIGTLQQNILGGNLK